MTRLANEQAVFQFLQLLHELTGQFTESNSRTGQLAD